MKTYIADIIPRIKQFSRKLDDLTLLENQHWVIIDEAAQTKQVFIFRKNSELLIATNGRVKKGKWEYLDNDSILIEKEEGMFLLKHGFLDGDILALKLDSNNEYAIFINESKYGQDLNDIGSVEKFFNAKYLTHKRDPLQKVPSSGRMHQATESFVPSKHLDSHTCPPSRRTFLETHLSIWAMTTAFRINYEDGVYGFLYQEGNGITYFEDSANDSRVFYKGFESAITAMYVYKTRNIIVPTDHHKTRFLSSILDTDMERKFGKE